MHIIITCMQSVFLIIVLPVLYFLCINHHLANYVENFCAMIVTVNNESTKALNAWC